MKVKKNSHFCSFCLRTACSRKEKGFNYLRIISFMTPNIHKVSDSDPLAFLVLIIVLRCLECFLNKYRWAIKGIKRMQPIEENIPMLVIPGKFLQYFLSSHIFLFILTCVNF